MLTHTPAAELRSTSPTPPRRRSYDGRSAFSDSSGTTGGSAWLSAGIGTAAGLLTAAAMPRGPITTSQALWLLAHGLLVGTLAGLALRSRWAMLLAPAANLLAFELGRRGTDGPTVDGLHFDTTFGILAIILAVVSMSLSAWSRWRSAPPMGRRWPGG